jgi:hypothetical protein
MRPRTSPGPGQIYNRETVDEPYEPYARNSGRVCPLNSTHRGPKNESITAASSCTHIVLIMITSINHLSSLNAYLGEICNLEFFYECGVVENPGPNSIEVLGRCCIKYKQQLAMIGGRDGFRI